MEQKRPKTDKSPLYASGYADESHALIAEQVLTEKGSRFVVWRDGEIKEEETLTLLQARTLLPIPATNNLLAHKVVLLPTAAGDGRDVQTLALEIAEHLERYVALSDDFRVIASWYIILSWVYDRFPQMPYLRLRGDYGSGKTRGLSVIGGLLYKPMFASGATTISPIFHTLDLFRGSLVFDEADFRFSDERAEITKILNSGTVAGFPVLRSVQQEGKVFDPKAFAVFGPKLVAMRHEFSDLALESRFLTEEMGVRPVPAHIPKQLPRTAEVEAEVLRGRLLRFRLDMLWKITPLESVDVLGISPRGLQMLLPLLSLAPPPDVRTILLRHVMREEKERGTTRAMSPASLLLQVTLAVARKQNTDTVKLRDVVSDAMQLHGEEFERPLTSRYVGSLMRTALRFTLWKSSVYWVKLPGEVELRELCSRYGVQLGQWDVGSK